jgi:hypothetical protein
LETQNGEYQYYLKFSYGEKKYQIKAKKEPFSLSLEFEKKLNFDIGIDFGSL